MSNDERIQKNSVVQATELAGEWMGCLLQVSEVYNWGVMAWVQIPMSGSAYIRLKFEAIEYVGQAVMSPEHEQE
jgi:hypothetical protein